MTKHDCKLDSPSEGYGAAIDDCPALPKIYLFSNSSDGDGIAYSMAEDGTVLGSHWCSHWGYMRHDLHDRKERRETCEAYYPNGYRLVVLGPNKIPPKKVLNRNKAQATCAREGK